MTGMKINPPGRQNIRVGGASQAVNVTPAEDSTESLHLLYNFMFEIMSKRSNNLSLT